MRARESPLRPADPGPGPSRDSRRLGNRRGDCRIRISLLLLRLYTEVGEFFRLPYPVFKLDDTWTIERPVVESRIPVAPSLVERVEDWFAHTAGQGTSPSIGETATRRRT